jgi:hypothetical protein
MEHFDGELEGSACIRLIDGVGNTVAAIRERRIGKCVEQAERPARPVTARSAHPQHHDPERLFMSVAFFSARTL